MVSSLKNITTTKVEYERKCIALQQQAKRDEMQITVLKSEVETATDFIFEQEHRLQ